MSIGTIGMILVLIYVAEKVAHAVAGWSESKVGIDCPCSRCRNDA